MLCLSGMNVMGVLCSIVVVSNFIVIGQLGEYIVGDVVNFYNINLLYQCGISGVGFIVVIVMLVDFDLVDVEVYWSGIGLVIKLYCIEQIYVDGGGSINGGSGEMVLDVEQVGGLVLFVDVLVYDVFNIIVSFFNVFVQVVLDNCVDSIFISWGLLEIYNFVVFNVDGVKVNDIIDVGSLCVFYQIFMEVVVQGQLVFVVSGDLGVYDIVCGFGYGIGLGEFSVLLMVDLFVLDLYIIVVGGIIMFFSFVFGSNLVVFIMQESVWGWSYLQNYFDIYYGVGVIDLFLVGGGGGVSSYWCWLVYQFFICGVQVIENYQLLDYNDFVVGLIMLFKLFNYFYGCNLLDILFNVDLEIGYLVVFSIDGGVILGFGGISFVVLQFNGIIVLLWQSVGYCIGLWNLQVYFLQNVFGYGCYLLFNSVNVGDNWFYYGVLCYMLGVGIGMLDVENFDLFLCSCFCF